MRSISVVDLERIVMRLCPEVAAQLSQQIRGPQSDINLWHEMLTCILASQVQYSVALAASSRIMQGGLYGSLVSPRDGLQDSIYELLANPFNVNGVSRRYRFPSLASRRIATTARHLQQIGHSIASLLDCDNHVGLTRRQLVEHVCGFGFKQASMFLRNIGHAFDLAVLDRHVIRYMKARSLLADRTPITLTGVAYERSESVFVRYAHRLGYCAAAVDYAIWVVMTTDLDR